MKIANLTDVSQLMKFGIAELPELMQAGQFKVDEYQKSLAKDALKTKHQKNLLLNEFSSKVASQLIAAIDSKHKPIRTRLDSFQQRIDAELKIKGTTDLLILQSTATALKNLHFADIANITADDADAARAVLLLPVERYTRNLTSEQSGFIQEALDKKILGREHSDFVKAGQQLEVLHLAGQNLLDVVIQIEEDISIANSTLAQEPELA